MSVCGADVVDMTEVPRGLSQMMREPADAGSDRDVAVCNLMNAYTAKTLAEARAIQQQCLREKIVFLSERMSAIQDKSSERYKKMEQRLDDAEDLHDSVSLSLNQFEIPV